MGGETYIFNICSNLSRDENRLFLIYTGLACVKLFFTPAELKPGNEPPCHIAYTISLSFLLRNSSFRLVSKISL